ncbi:helix-turn-helix transcriptional regulator [Kitasatospora sp. MBT63]|uniref:helix-turn-helix transcriptional regulator n=1 Tax=Kitasatospora sp. MBT63 TaxID=1444768 RepID=UPI00053989EC|nr:LuxR family transcriptional regulator [Kitasatospora sp. MBT63]
MLITSPVVIGRARELGLLGAGLAAAQRGEGRAVFLLGEAGIGKSRLAAECAYRAVADGTVVLRGRAGSSGAPVPFRPITEALLALFRIGGPPQDPALAPYRPALAALVPEWRGTADPEVTPSLTETAEAFLRLLAAVGRGPAGRRPAGCLLIVEDLHDADAETLAVVDHLVDNLAGLPVQLVATLRSGAGPAAELAHAAGARRAADLAELRPLAPAEVRALAESCLAAPAGGLPETVTARLVRDCGGNPFVVEELLSGMVAAGVIRQDGQQGWQVGGDLGIEVPTTVVRSVAQRAARLDPAARELLYAAAVLGRRFALPVLQLVTGLDDRSLLIHLRAGIDAQLISPGGPVADWYEFRHALTTDALLAALLPVERAAIARRAAEAVEQAHPGLPGEWRHLVAVLRQTAGDTAAAGLLFAEAGRGALAGGAVSSAVSLLERAHGLIAPDDGPEGPGPDGGPAVGSVGERPAAPEDATAVLESLVFALVETGRLDRALALAETVPVGGPGALDDARTAALHTRLAWAAVSAGRPADAAAQVALVRALLTRFDGSAHTPALDVVEAHLVLTAAPAEGAAADRTAEAQRLARRAAEQAERAGLPEVACQAWQLLAMLERRHGFDRADACLERILALAVQESLPTWQVDALLRLGVNEFMRSGSSAQLERAHRAALGLGALGLMHTAEATLAMQAVLRGEYRAAGELTDRCLEATAGLRNVDHHQFVLLTRAAVAAHQGRRPEMERELDRFRRWDGDRSLQLPLAYGNCRAVCALLEEDRDRALTELEHARLWEEQNPTVFYLNGRYGLRPLLRALAGLADPAEHTAAAADPAAGLLWNRQFERLAHAVHEGRAGRHDAAALAVEEAVTAGRPFLMARHLGLRLVSEAALADGWGDPVRWLRTAEEYFHGAAVPAVANACRHLLRRAGASVPQRRTGADRVPAELRRQGLTVREHEVLLLVAQRLGNQEIAARLHISPRTVEKHVASLLTKTGRPHRTALSDFAAAATAGPAGLPSPPRLVR